MNLYDFEVKKSNGETLNLADFEGKPVVIINTATKCGFAPQFDGLEALWQEYKDQELVMLGFPCNQFANQEPGSDDEVAEACRINFGVTFPIMAKIDVNGDNADPLFNWLTESAPGLLGSKRIKWNFTKFVIDRNGEVVKRFSPKEEPASMRDTIEQVVDGSGA